MGSFQSNLNSSKCNKIIMLGDPNVGKSTLLVRFTTDEFEIESKSTTSVNGLFDMVTYARNPIEFQFWDTNDRERPLTQSYYNEAIVAVIVYDITNRKSFENLEGWLKELRPHRLVLKKKKKLISDPVIILVGTKSDLSHLRAVPENELISFAWKEYVQWVETSALDDINVTEALKRPINEALRKKGQSGELRANYCLRVDRRN